MALITSKKALCAKIDALQDALDNAQKQTVQGIYIENGVEQYTFTRETVTSNNNTVAYKFSVSGADLSTKPTTFNGFPACVGSTWFATNGNFYMFDGTNWGAL